MPFPETPKVQYNTNTLIEVICQIRFPPILKIDSDLVRYQELVRKEYPYFKARLDGPPIGETIGELPPKIVEFLGSSNRVYDFASEDEQWIVSLSKEFIALRTFNYSNWSEFKSKFSNPLKVLENEFDPSFYSRIGLRYKNIIQRSNLGLNDVRWSELLSKNILNELATLDESSVLNVAHKVEIQLNDLRGQVRIAHGFVLDNTKEICYLIDNDFFVEQKVAKNEAISTLNYFNERAGRLFHWCISDRLHDVLGPTQL